MTRPIDCVVSALEAHGCKPRNGSARCPAHDDKDPSLTYSEGSDGRVLLHCFTGCSFDSIVSALGLEETDLFDSDNETHNRPPAERWISTTPVPGNAPEPEPHKRLGKSDGRYEYKDTAGRPLGWVTRWDLPNGKKEIRPLTYGKMSDEPPGFERWQWKSWSGPAPLFGLDLLSNRPDAPVLVVEGEKTTLVARMLFPAHCVTTSPGGSGRASKADWYPLKGRRVVIWPDCDEPGRKYAGDVARLSLAAGASSVRLVDVPTIWPEKWDLADDPPEGVTVADLRRMVADATPTDTKPVLTWGNEPLPLQRPIPDSEPYPVEALGEILGPACRVLAEIVQAPLATCAHSVLSAGALVAQPHHDVEIDGRRIPLSLYLVSVLESGGRKSAVDRVALSPLAREEEADKDRFKGEWSSHEADLAAWTQSKNDALRKGKDRTAKRASIEALGPKPDPPMSSTLTTAEPTYEGLVKLLVNRPFVGLYSDEGGRLIGGHAMSADQKLKTLAGMSGLWDGTKISRTRAGDGDSTLYGRRVAMHIMVQPEVAVSLLGDSLADGQGFLARCLVAAPLSTVGDQHYVAKDPAKTPEFQRYADALRRLFRRALPLADDSWKLEPVSLRLDRKAKEAWIRFHDLIQTEMKEGGSLETVRRLGAKAAEHVLRLTGVIATIEDPDAKTLSALNVERGIRLVMFYLSEDIRLRGSSLADPDLVAAEKLLKWMQGRPLSTVPVRDIYRLGPSEIRNKARAEKLLAILERHGLARRIEGWTDPDGVRRTAWEVRQ